MSAIVWLPAAVRRPLLTAIFGVGAMNATGLDYGKRLYPKANVGISSDSSCGSSSGGGCGGSGS